MIETVAARQTRLYEEAMGRGRRLRYEDFKVTRCPSCWQHFEEGHHPLCSRAPRPVEQEIPLDGRAALV